ISLARIGQVLDCVDHWPHIFRIKVLDQFVDFAVELPVSRVGGGVFDRADNIFRGGRGWVGLVGRRNGKSL
ncbi:MAG TPA: hypothetical protein VJ278_03995, partial [Chthoniobacterales bacterium]|nr:hypothetical protein [Chthoniobacterales bacterium]